MGERQDGRPAGGRADDHRRSGRVDAPLLLGVTIVAAFNGVVVGLGAWALGVPLAGTIAVVTFVTAYIPFIGAFIAGAFAVVLALGSQGTRSLSSCS